MRDTTQIKKFLNRAEAAKYIGLSTHWLAKHAETGIGPKYVRHGRSSWYKRTDLDEWMAARSGGTVENLTLEERRAKGATMRVQPKDSELAAIFRDEWGVDEAPSAPRYLHDLVEKLSSDKYEAVKAVLEGMVA